MPPPCRICPDEGPAAAVVVLAASVVLVEATVVVVSCPLVDVVDPPQPARAASPRATIEIPRIKSRDRERLLTSLNLLKNG